MVLINIILASVIILALIIGSFTDFKKREVPDWLSYSMVGAGLGLRLLYSALSNDWMFFAFGVAGFALCFGLALLMFYAGQWGGGDSKVIMGLGALIGFDFMSFDLMKNSLLFSFFVNMLFVGAVYGVIFGAFLAVKHRKKFGKKFKEILFNKKYAVVLRAALFLSIASAVSAFFIFDALIKTAVFVLALVIFLALFLLIFSKAVEQSSMFKEVKPAELTEGDWIVKDIKYKGKYICGPKDLGIEKKQIKKLVELYKKNKIKKVLIKEGIPFVPAFLLAYLISLIYGNLLLVLMGVY